MRWLVEYCANQKATRVRKEFFLRKWVLKIKYFIRLQMTGLSAVLVCCVAGLVGSFPAGPFLHADVCTGMTPKVRLDGFLLGHGAEPQSSATAPFEIVVDSMCYNENTNIQGTLLFIYFPRKTERFITHRSATHRSRNLMSLEEKCDIVECQNP